MAIFILAALPGAPGAPGALAANPIPFPHPQITEVLFNVPAGDAGDASADGTRDATGDEFIEIANPFDKPINLKGYVLSSRLSSPAKDTAKGVRFAFPECELPAHGVAVVFNGFGHAPPGPVGTEQQPPPGPNERFAGALVFVTPAGAKHRALSNAGDFILLTAPDGAPVDVVTWGEPQPGPPKAALRTETVPANPKGSVQRLEPDAPMEPHAAIDAKPFSPGVIPERAAR